MNFLQHILGGLLVFTVVIFLLGFVTLNNIFSVLIAYAIAIVSSILPDVDTKNSLISKFLNLVIGILLFLYLVTTNGLNILSIIIFIVIFVLWYFFISNIIFGNHRGHFHSIIVMIVLGLATWVASGFSILMTIAVVVPYFVHLCLDRCWKLW